MKTKTSTEQKYEAFKMMESMKLSKDDLVDSVRTLEELLLEQTEEERKVKYLFEKGLNKASQNYTHAKSKYPTMSMKEKIEFRVREEEYKEKIRNLNPLINLLINLKSILE